MIPPFQPGQQVEARLWSLEGPMVWVPMLFLGPDPKGAEDFYIVGPFPWTVFGDGEDRLVWVKNLRAPTGE